MQHPKHVPLNRDSGCAIFQWHRLVDLCVDLHLRIRFRQRLYYSLGDLLHLMALRQKHLAIVAYPAASGYAHDGSAASSHSCTQAIEIDGSIHRADMVSTGTVHYRRGRVKDREPRLMPQLPTRPRRQAQPNHAASHKQRQSWHNYSPSSTSTNPGVDPMAQAAYITKYTTQQPRAGMASPPALGSQPPNPNHPLWTSAYPHHVSMDHAGYIGQRPPTGYAPPPPWEVRQSAAKKEAEWDQISWGSVQKKVYAACSYGCLL